MATDSKAALRRAARAHIAALTPDFVRESDGAIAARVAALPEFRAAARVFAYFSVKNECGTAALTALALSSGKALALPVCEAGGRMAFYPVSSPEALRPGMYGIPEPETEGEPLRPGAGDFILVPALRFDRSGYRLGQGGGYYDRFLAARGGAFACGLARDGLLAEALPRDAYDMRADCVVTESRTLRNL